MAQDFPSTGLDEMVAMTVCFLIVCDLQGLPQTIAGWTRTKRFKEEDGKAVQFLSYLACLSFSCALSKELELVAMIKPLQTSQLESKSEGT